MDWHDAVNGSLPPPLDEEPAQLRRDIEDELADHLGCAYQQELAKSADPGQAQQAAINRFGNPRKIARQLWFEAMKEKIMNQRIQMMSLVLLTVAVIAVLAFSWTSMQRAQETNQAMLAALTKIAQGGPSKAGAEANWTNLRVKVYFGNGTEPARDIPVKIYGKPFRDETDELEEKTDTVGACSFGPIRPGKYTVRVGRAFSPDTSQAMSQSLRIEKSVVLYPSNEMKTEILYYPKVTMVPTRIKLALPPDVPSENLLLATTIFCLPIKSGDLDGVLWDSGYRAAYMNGQGEQAGRVQIVRDSNKPEGFGFDFEKGPVLLPESGVTLRSVAVFSQVASPNGNEPIYQRVANLEWGKEEKGHSFKPVPGRTNEWVVQLKPQDAEEIRKGFQKISQNSEVTSNTLKSKARPIAAPAQSR